MGSNQKITSVRITFDKLYHDTGMAILVSINGSELWLPKKLCRNIIVNKKLGGHVSIPTFLAEKLNIVNCSPDIEVIHHIPEQKANTNITHDKSLFK